MLKKLLAFFCTLVLFAAICVLFLVFFGGRIRYNNFHAKWEQRGVTFELEPQAVIPEGQDFREATVIVDWLESDEPRVYTELLDQKRGFDIQFDEFDNTITFLSAEELKEVRLKSLFQDHLQQSQLVKDELHAAVHLPYAYCSDDFALMDELFDLLRLMGQDAFLEVSMSNTHNARRDFATMLRLPEKVCRSCEAGLFPMVMELKAIDIVTKSIWASLELESWDAASLSALESECRRIEVLQRFPQIMISEIASNDSEFRHSDTSVFQPKIWFKENIAMNHIVTSHEVMAETLIWDHEKQQVASELTVSMADRLQNYEEKILSRPEFVDRFTHPTSVPTLLRNFVVGAIKIQQRIEIAAIACALKRYKLEHGAYPDSMQDAGITHARDYFNDQGEGLVYESKGDHFSITTKGEEVCWNGDSMTVNYGVLEEYSWRDDLNSSDLPKNIRNSVEEVLVRFEEEGELK